MDLLDEFQKVIDSLNDAGVDYAVVGALALAIHGAPRATTDIDLLVSGADIERVLELVRPLGFTLPAEPMTFGRTGITIQRVTKVSGGEPLTLDLMAAEPPLDGPWEARIKVDAGDRTLWVVSRDGLLQMKALAGRLQDLADIGRLEELATEEGQETGAGTDEDA